MRRSPVARDAPLGSTLAIALAIAVAAPARASDRDGEPPAAPPPPSVSVQDPGARSTSLLVRPHLSAGVLAGSHMLGFSLDAGVRFHPVLVLYSAWVSGADDTGEYLTFSGVKVGYQHTLHEWFAAYGALGFGRARYHPEDGGTRGGTATTVDVGLAVAKKHAMNLLSVGAQAVIPDASGLPAGSRLGGTRVYFVATLNPILLLLGGI